MYNDTSSLKQAALGSLPILAPLLFPDRPTESSRNEIRIGNRGSLCINLRTGEFFDHESKLGGDVISLVQYARQCDFREALEYLQEFYRIAPTPSQPVKRKPKAKNTAERRKKALGLWEASQPLIGTLAEYYLRHVRGLALDELPGDVRFHPNIRHFKAKRPFPSAIAALRDPAGKIAAVHCVFLNPQTGQKIALENIPAKLSFAPISGAAVKLPGTPDHSDKLAICEGLEDALSIVELTGWSCWALCGTGNFSNIEIPHHFEAVTIASDADTAGKNAALTLAHRLRNAPYPSRIVQPPGEAKDWNEHLQKEKAGAATPAQIRKDFQHV